MMRNLMLIICRSLRRRQVYHRVMTRSTIRHSLPSAGELLCGRERLIRQRYRLSEED